MVGLSGVMSIFFCAIVLAHRNYWNLSIEGQLVVSRTMGSIRSCTTCQDGVGAMAARLERRGVCGVADCRCACSWHSYPCCRPSEASKPSLTFATRSCSRTSASVWAWRHAPPCSGAWDSSCSPSCCASSSAPCTSSRCSSSPTVTAAMSPSKRICSRRCGSLDCAAPSASWSASLISATALPPFSRFLHAL